MHYVYVLYSDKLKKRYIGKTSNLRQRIDQHNKGKSSFTRRGMPWRLIYYEAFLNKEDATNEELFLKTGKGRERLQKLLPNHFGRVA